ncbi:MAG TPA: formate/nitrite transporter family protein [Acidocella sp.]|jgi:formate/nitrite transporter FocA (FNT family)|uniref:formate/nitrite transporter family protein n=1 Tax=Acidocella sp. TaxID=50710 RepID=UPI002D0F368D|nr:formate/nitrite transporter family protein [Acidocella sp.]HVE21157.1 formate/nitrite transporter family protein [Acidocella sp.]
MDDLDDRHDMSEGSKHLGRDEQRLAFRHAVPHALVIHEIIREQGENELARTNLALALSGFAAGLSMGFSFLTQALLQAGLPDAVWRHTLVALGYSVGFMIVVMARQQLFTESTLTAVLPVITRRDMATALAAARLWSIVLVTNLLGTWLFAVLVHLHGIFPPDVTQAMTSLAQQAIPPDLFATFLRAFFAGWLIALMVWILPSAQSARLLTIVIITYVVALAQLSHIVAGSAEAAYDVLSAHATLASYAAHFMLPTLCGNICGGVLMVSALNHGAVASEIHGEAERPKR